MHDLLKQLDRIHSNVVNTKQKDIQAVELGRTETNRSIYGYKYIKNISNEYIVIIGASHGNEPMGAWYCIDLLNKILFTECGSMQESEANFFIIPILDMEIAEKNSIWINQAFDYRLFFKHNYLNPTYSQVEFSYNMKGKGNAQSELMNSFEQELAKLKCKIILNCHQTPSIYGGYYYTNIKSKVIYKGLQEAFKNVGIPPEICPQGKGIEILDTGIFGVFRSENLGEYHNRYKLGYCSQQYFNDVLNVPYVTIEIPFGFSSYLYSKQLINIEALTPMITEILSEGNVFLTQLKAMSEVSDVTYSGIYWLLAFENIYKALYVSLEQKKDYRVRAHDLMEIIRMLFYKAEYLGMLLEDKNTMLAMHANKLLVKIIKFMEIVLPAMHVKWVDKKAGVLIIEQCINTIIRYKDEVNADTKSHL